jgi:hypothetical protein
MQDKKLGKIKIHRNKFFYEYENDGSEDTESKVRRIRHIKKDRERRKCK